MSMIRWYLLYMSRWHLPLNSRGKEALPLGLSLPVLWASSQPCKIQQDKKQDAWAQTGENVATLLCLPFDCVCEQASLRGNLIRSFMTLVPSCLPAQQACDVICQDYGQLAMQGGDSRLKHGCPSNSPGRQLLPVACTTYSHFTVETLTPMHLTTPNMLVNCQAMSTHSPEA